MTRVKDPEKLPDATGVYIFRDRDDRVLYVGKSISIRKRVSSYFREQENPRLRIMMRHLESIEYILTQNEKEALILESNLIKRYRPPYNVRLKDDKRYPFIKITDEEYPRVLIVRTIGRDSARYYGPFTDTGAVRRTLKLIKSLFRIRSCRRMDGPCLNSQIDLCYAPCDGRISREDYREIIEKVDLFFQGRYQEVIEVLEEEMKEASERLEFERAARIRDQIESIREVMERQHASFTDSIDQDIVALERGGDTSAVVVLQIRDGKITGKDDFILRGSAPRTEILEAFLKQYYAIPRRVPSEILTQYPVEDGVIAEWLSELRGEEVKIHSPEGGAGRRLLNIAWKNASVILKQKGRVRDALLQLKDDLKLPEIPRRMEGLDISNIAGESATGSVAVFIDGKPSSGSYRRYRISAQGPDDYAMMRELVERRYSSPELRKPDLVLIDGGKGQLGVALEALKNCGVHVPVVGIAKKREEVYLPGLSEPVDVDDGALQILRHLRDEAHRFAVKYHRTIRDRDSLESELDGIRGVGPVRKRALLEHFGSLDGVRDASVEELASIPGMTREVAERIHRHFSGDLAG
ncbi:excinuclease ABC subunit C [Methanothermobacter sp. CaT2]|uniref:UvrABC system protein C n=2 Tax=Methanothermobacter TaxID=145260 RepID=UVRC_METTH|nr:MULTISPECIES: excinuclease ABC subunit UvrC [Methanothermobacter]O26541.1 RecName: Full=UvrABC system protein C; Short=Protein UvrC; AltName: Full=Excinuclease ABC subunit C [Methanothermobacter thermautotrophicus str. Delta H]AAB84947.1 excinuclease ABC subunit C [Methanothermobacter thermautotrophicus str. Delta H]REE28891.1 excinuclease ABC subunit C [Methanothermobacter defluvii]WBF06722.1 excinuclease ABC subunit C [Methanothermobacter thermautotrophicus]BAM69630.1 excinuclease ABC sub